VFKGLTQDVAQVVAVGLEKGPDRERWVLPQVRDLLAGFLGVPEGLGGLPAHPGDDRDAVVAEDHQRVVRVAHDAGQLCLHDPVERRDDGRFVEFLLVHVSLCLSLFPWAKFRRLKGGVKLHVLLSHDDYLPEYLLITKAHQADVRCARQFKLSPGSIVVLDRAYIDYNLLADWSRAGVFWVTRTKTNLELIGSTKRELPQNRNILADQLVRRSIELTSRQRFPVPLRRVIVWDEQNQRQISLLTNILDFGATTIAGIYKERWKIELFFKTLKQNLKIKTFVGTTENALRIQIWTALLALLILKWLHFLSRANWSLSNLAAMLRLNLFTYRDLTAWLNNPNETPPLIPPPEQFLLLLAPLGQLTS